MTLSASFYVAIEPQNDFTNYEYLEGWLPRSFTEPPLNGAANHFIPAIVMTTVQQLLRDVGFMRLLKYNDPGAEILGALGKEVGKLRYADETDQHYKERIINVWSSSLNIGTELGMQDEFVYAGFTSSSLAFNLTRLDNIITASGGGSTYDIQPYPASTNYKSQFNVYLYPSADMLAKGTGSLSNVVPDSALYDAREIIEKYRPANWICRELIIVTNGTGSAGTVWGTSGATWGASGSQWGGTGGTLERHRGSLLY